MLVSARIGERQTHHVGRLGSVIGLHSCHVLADVPEPFNLPKKHLILARASRIIKLRVHVVMA